MPAVGSSSRSPPHIQQRCSHRCGRFCTTSTGLTGDCQDAVEVIAATSVEVSWQAWRRPITVVDGADLEELVTSVSRRLCLGDERRRDVEQALYDIGVRPDRPFLGPEWRELVTIWWDGGAA